jgi:hypothetical protein
VALLLLEVVLQAKQALSTPTLSHNPSPVALLFPLVLYDLQAKFGHQQLNIVWDPLCRVGTL